MPHQRERRRRRKSRFRFSTFSLLGVMSLLGISAWANLEETLVKWFATTLLISLAGAVIGMRRSSKITSPILWGGVCGLLNVCCLELVRLACIVGGYYSHKGANAYFEDGFFLEVIFYPALAVFVLGFSALCVGAILGGVLWCTLESLGTLSKHFK